MLSGSNLQRFSLHQYCQCCTSCISFSSASVGTDPASSPPCATPNRATRVLYLRTVQAEIGFMQGVVCCRWPPGSPLRFGLKSPGLGRTLALYAPFSGCHLFLRVANGPKPMLRFPRKRNMACVRRLFMDAYWAAAPLQIDAGQ
jgi:hypothetical protein